MGAMDHQLGVKDEVTYGTALTVDRFFEYDSESIEETEGRTEGDPLRVGSSVLRNDRFTPYFAGAAGSLTIPVMTKGCGWFLKHMLGSVATTGPAETTVYTHTGTEGALFGKSFTMQMNRPFHPSGTNQAFTYEGGKITEWTLSNSVDNNLMLELGLDFESIEETEGRTEGDPLRVGSSVLRNDRFTPYFAGAAGSLTIPVMTKGCGWFLKHMLGSVATTGPAETTVYTHTGTEGALFGKSFTMQMNRPFHPSGTNQAFTYEGGKITEWTLSNSVDNNLMLELGLDFEQVATATALATASYPTGMENFTWAGGVVSIGGSSYDITEFSLQWNNGYNVDRRQIRGNTDKKEPTSSRREGSFSIKADFDSLTQRNRAHATTRTAALAQIVATWTGPTLLGTTIYPTFQVTIPAARFDAWKGATEGTDAIEQELSGVVRYDGTNSPVTIVYKSADTTA